ncbi:MAG TPA: TonB family protein [Rhizomicrobium sp.]|nr:TonB family protein [Rhizomicrobium sp.]
MTPIRRLAAGCFVLVLHVLIAWAFIVQPPVTTPRQTEVRVTLVAPSAPPSPTPPPLPLLTPPRPATIAPPEVTLLRPPPPSISAPYMAQGSPAPPPAPPAPKPPPDYLSRLAAYLNSYKNYPYGARQRREQGTVRLHFVMDRAGHVLSFQVAGSSGWADLDNEARALILRAQPLPPVPKDYPGETLDLIVPVVFSLH